MKILSALTPEYLLQQSAQPTTQLFDGLVLANGRDDVQALLQDRRDLADHYAVSLAAAQSRLAVHDMARPFTLDPAGRDGLLLLVPRQRLEALLPGAIDLHGAAPRGPFAVLAASHLRSLARLLPRATAADAPYLARVTLQLIGASLAPTPEELAQNHMAIDDVLRRDVCSHIDAHLAEPECSVQSICRAFRMSRATLYRLFEPFGGVVTEIRKRRLLHARAALIAEGPERSIGRIAERLGFKSSSQFSRAFREQFGQCPSEVAGA